MGGRASEEIFFGEISTGAQNDLITASDTARRMVTEYGMSEHQGPVAFEKERNPIFLDTGYNSSRVYSEETAHEIDEEVKKLVNDSYKKSKALLESKRSVLERIAKILLEREVLEGDELRRLLKEETSTSGQQMAA